MNLLKQFLGKLVDIEISGDKRFTGILIDIGLDIDVIYDGTNYIYIPAAHIQNISRSNKHKENELIYPDDPHQQENDISFRKVLNNAKGQFIELYISGTQSIHGFITSILTNYFVFYSPIFKTMFIPFFHLKWLIPYQYKKAPYSLDKILLPIHSSEITLARTFEEQIKKLEGNIVVFDLGHQANKIGLLKKVEQNIVELVTAGEQTIYFNIQHLKMVHSP